MSENVGASTSRNPKGLHGLLRDNFTTALCGFTKIVAYEEYRYEVFGKW
jgi:hypothetical protein